MLATKLTTPIAWSRPDPEIGDFLGKLQGNILKYHGRSNVVFMFCHFLNSARPAAHGFMQTQVHRVQSALRQLQMAQHKHASGQADRAPFVSIFLTRRGYDYFGIPAARQPPDPQFRAGMAASNLKDPPTNQWDPKLVDPHAMILVAVTSADEAQREATALLNQLSGIADLQLSRDVIGNQFFNPEGEGIENFGYVDGRSQPLVLKEDIAKPDTANREWSGMQLPVDQFVIPDPGVHDAHAYGSYFVFRQLHQDVKGFKDREDEINAGHDNDGVGDFINRDSAGVGRLESGTPYEMTNDDHDTPDITNKFVFTSAPPACPHFAHIRKVNPRTPETRVSLMIRRGMTYGTRNDAAPDPKIPANLVIDPKKTFDPVKSTDVGLLFQSYQANIKDQFETTQNWANSTGNGGIDPVIGQAQDAIVEWPRLYRSTSTETVNFYRRPGGTGSAPGTGSGSYVTLRGGGYFFAPSLPFLATL